MESMNPIYHFIPTSLHGWSVNRAIALETEFIELFSKKRDDFGVIERVTARGIC